MSRRVQKPQPQAPHTQFLVVGYAQTARVRGAFVQHLHGLSLFDDVGVSGDVILVGVRADDVADAQPWRLASARARSGA